MSTKKGGWTKRERELVRLWAAQISINRHRHQLASDSFAQTSFWLQLFCILVTAVVAVISFVSSYFDEEPTIVRALGVTAGVLALCAGALNAIFARISPDTMSEQHRHTGIHYANYSNEIQSELVEDDDKLPPAREFLARIRNGVHLLHSFGPALDETTESDLPSKFLVQEYDGSGKVQPAGAPAGVARLPTGYDMFKRDDETASARAERRRAALEQLRRDKEEIAARKKALAEEEDDLQNAIAQNDAKLKKARSSADVTQSMPVIPQATHVHDRKMSMPAPQRDNILNLDSESEPDHADTLAHGSDTDQNPPPYASIQQSTVQSHHASAVQTMRVALHGTAEVEAKAKAMRAELRRRYALLQQRKASLTEAMNACENKTSELESVEDIPSESPLQKSGVVSKIKSALKKSFSPPPVTEEDVIAMETQRVRDLGFGEEIV
jgi:hypothetical protein